LREKEVAIVVGCCVGEFWGELLARDDRSDDELCMDTSFDNINH